MSRLDGFSNRGLRQKNIEGHGSKKIRKTWLEAEKSIASMCNN